MEITCVCPKCNKEFIWKGSGLSHFNRAKNHYCSIGCKNVIHGLARRDLKTNKQDDKYQMWCHARKRAKKNNLEIDITPFDIPEIPELCPVLGIKITRNIKENSKNHGPSDNSPSLDRIDTSLGYIKSNIRIISNRANRIKSDSSFEEIEKIYKDLLKWNIK
jgi:hypothetical protein